MTEEILHNINENLGRLIAFEDSKLAGFVCLASISHLPEHPVIKSMYETLPTQKFEISNSLNAKYLFTVLH